MLLSLAVNGWILLGCAAVDLALPARRPCLLLRGLSSNLFAVFLLANALTGLVNVAFRPLLASPAEALT